MLSIRSAIIHTSFAKDYFVSATGGSIIFGNVKLDNAVLHYEKYCCVFHKKFEEFLNGLKVLGANIVSNKKTTVKIELSRNEFLHFEANKIVKRSKTEENLCSIEFDQFMYIDFLSALGQIVIFVTNPTPRQHKAFKEYVETIEHITTYTI